MPIDHLPKSLRDSDCFRRDAETERRKGLYRQARAASAAVMTTITRQRAGNLTRSEGAVLSHMVLANLRACVRGERFYRPTRKGIARETGYTERTVSAALSRLKAAGCLVVARYGQGGRLGHQGKGIATEYRSGCLQWLADQLAALGYRLPAALKADLIDLGRWAARQVGEATEAKPDTPQKPTGKKLPGIVMLEDRAAPGSDRPAPVEAGECPVARCSAPPGHVPRLAALKPCREAKSDLRTVTLPRPPLGRLATAALLFSAKSQASHGRGRLP